MKKLLALLKRNRQLERAVSRAARNREPLARRALAGRRSRYAAPPLITPRLSHGALKQ